MNRGAVVDFYCQCCGADPGKQQVSAADVTCGECTASRPFARADIVNVTGCPGTGKSTVGRLLARRLGAEYVVVDTDMLNQSEDNVDEHTWATFIERLLQLGVCLAFSAHTLVLVGYSTPWQWDEQPLRHFLGEIHHLALVCSDDELGRRLSRRPWIDATERPGLLNLNRRFRTMDSIPRIDTTTAAPHDVADILIARIAAITGREPN